MLGKVQTNEIYRVIGYIEQDDKFLVQVQMVNSSRNFSCNVKDLYREEWLKGFSKEDCAYIAMLYFAEKHQKLEIIKYFPRKAEVFTSRLLLIGIIYTAFLLLSNIAGSKVAYHQGITFPAALVLFPITYILDDIMTEVYGFRASRTIIWSALGANLIMVLGSILIVKLQPSEYWKGQLSFEEVFYNSPRILLASSLAYIFGEFLNAFFLSKMKIRTRGKHLWLRSIFSTSAGALVDSIIFGIVAFLWVVPFKVVLGIIAVQYAFKVGYAILAIPIVYYITKYLKKTDNIDTYDYGTDFNPFSWKH